MLGLNDKVFEEINCTTLARVHNITLYKTIAKYTRQETFTGTLKWIAYRILQFVKRLLPCFKSDWQKAHKLYADRCGKKNDDKTLSDWLKRNQAGPLNL